jgi:hypothetical protein
MPLFNNCSHFKHKPPCPKWNWGRIQDPKNKKQNGVLSSLYHLHLETGKHTRVQSPPSPAQYFIKVKPKRSKKQQDNSSPLKSKSTTKDLNNNEEEKISNIEFQKIIVRMIDELKEEKQKLASEIKEDMN